MKHFVIDCHGIATDTDLWHRYLAVTNLAAAGYFGCNLDAFLDAVEGSGPGYPGRCKLTFKNAATLSHIKTGSGVSLLDALQDIARAATVVVIEF
ncbi:barstar family protein [Ensifer canadensis]